MYSHCQGNLLGRWSEDFSSTCIDEASLGRHRQYENKEENGTK
jgi:hypothetical protein